MPSISFLPAAGALLLLFGGSAAAAAVSSGLADTGGFLLGNAHRCGVAADRVAGAGKVISGLIAQAARDKAEQADASRRFADAFRANAASRATSPPPCPAVVIQFELLERHYREIGLN